MIRLLLALLALAWSIDAQASEENVEDAFLRMIIHDFNIRPLPTKSFEETEKFKLGRALFFDPILSGNRDVSCATCHLLRHGTSDGLPFSIGTGGIGVGNERVPAVGRPQQPRNALDLWNRDNNRVTSMFWDGGVEVLDPVGRVFRSPLGQLLPTGLDNLMAVQALFPLARIDEMLGDSGDFSPPDLPRPHAQQENELAGDTKGLDGAVAKRDAVEQADDALRDRTQVVQGLRVELDPAERRAPALVLAREIGLQQDSVVARDDDAVQARKFGPGRQCPQLVADVRREPGVFRRDVAPFPGHGRGLPSPVDIDSNAPKRPGRPTACRAGRMAE